MDRVIKEMETHSRKPIDFLKKNVVFNRPNIIPERTFSII